MGIMGGKALLAILILMVGVGMSISGGYVSWHKDDFACLGGRRWYAQVDKQTLFSIGALKFKYQPLNYGCPAERQYDASKYQVVGGELVGK